MMTDTTDLPSTQRVTYDDVDDIIEAAVRLKHADAQALSISDLQEVAAELDIDPHYVEQALTELERRKRLQDHKREIQKKRRLIAASILATLLLAITAGAFILQSGLRADLHATQGQRAQVINALERQQATLNQWQDAPDSRERSAEISGAQNRVSIERRRYDDAASAYNQRADGFLATPITGLFGLPTALPLSHEIEAW